MRILLLQRHRSNLTGFLCELVRVNMNGHVTYRNVICPICFVNGLLLKMQDFIRVTDHTVNDAASLLKSRDFS